jgi:hypothetical protein
MGSKGDREGAVTDAEASAGHPCLTIITLERVGAVNTGAPSSEEPPESTA